MSMEDLRFAYNLLQKENVEYWEGTPGSDELILQIENYLKLRFPPTYKSFLKKSGTITFGGKQIYGTTRSGMDAQSAPCVKWSTERAQKAGDISPTMIRILPSGYGPFFVIDTAEVDEHGESPVYMLPVGGIMAGEKKREAVDFGEFLRKEVVSTIMHKKP